MKIISKHKDYYDHEVAYFGYDETRVYDRRKMVSCTGWQYNQFEIALCGKIVPIVKFRGEYLFDKNPALSIYDNEFFTNKGRETKLNEKFRSPVVILNRRDLNSFEIPILSNIGFPKIYNSRTMYSMIYDYLGWLKDNPELPNNQTDKEKVVSHGFDKKTSFRPKIKLTR